MVILMLQGCDGGGGKGRRTGTRGLLDGCGQWVLSSRGQSVVLCGRLGLRSGHASTVLFSARRHQDRTSGVCVLVVVVVVFGVG